MCVCACLCVCVCVYLKRLRSILPGLRWGGIYLPIVLCSIATATDTAYFIQVTPCKSILAILAISIWQLLDALARELSPDAFIATCHGIALPLWTTVWKNANISIAQGGSARRTIPPWQRRAFRF